MGILWESYEASPEDFWVGLGSCTGEPQGFFGSCYIIQMLRDFQNSAVTTDTELKVWIVEKEAPICGGHFRGSCVSVDIFDNECKYHGKK